jgi:membrane protein DedA with SNARE-associated domain
MTIESLIQTYGYVAIFVGTFLEGETVLILSGLAAHQGYLQLPWVILAAFAGTLFGDQLYFYLGRWHSHGMLAKHPRWQARVNKAQRLLERYRTMVIISFRFMYGLRTVTPFVIGMSRVPTIIFIMLNVVSAFAWALAMGVGGYFFGHALEIIIGDIKHYELEVLGVVVIIGAMLWFMHLYRRRRLKTMTLNHRRVRKGRNKIVGMRLT